MQRKEYMDKNKDKLDFKEAFQEFAKKELEFYKSAKKDKLYSRVLPDLKDKHKGTIDFYYNGIIIGGYMYTPTNTITLNKLRTTKFGKEEDIPEAVKMVEDKIKEVEMVCDNQLK